MKGGVCSKVPKFIVETLSLSAAKRERFREKRKLFVIL
jgi:hypothetical protein